jgi:glycosyltransferase involved in cell wall biosynthesis
MTSRWRACNRQIVMLSQSRGQSGFDCLTVFFPMWNEESYVLRAVEAARDACRSLVASGVVADYEILIIDDASTDRTGALADGLAAADRHVRVIHHPRNRKLGGCLKTGFASARGDLVLYSDADLPFDMDEIHKACRLLRIYEADIVSAYRHDRTSEGLWRMFLSAGYNALIHLVFGLSVRDINFSFKLCRRRIFEHIALQSESSFIDAELLIRAHRLGFRIVQFGVDYFPRTFGTSTLSSFAVIKRLVQEMRELRPDLRRLQPLPAELLALAAPRERGFAAPQSTASA